MERVIRNRSATLRKTFYVNGIATDPTGTPTVAVTRADGTAVAAGSVVDEADVGTWSVTIPATSNTLLDTLTVRWIAFFGESQEYVDTVEVAGDVLFSVAQAQALLPSATAAQIADARAYAETEIERALGYALVPRYTLEKRTGRWCHALHVRNPYVRAIRSATVNGTALTSPQLADLSFDANGFVTGYGWGATWNTLSNVTIGYEHGLDTPPPGASKAALDEAVAYLGGSTANGAGGGIDPRAESVVTVDGTVRLRASTGTLLSATAADWVQANRLALIA